MKKACDLGVGGSDRDQLHWLQNSLWAALIRMLDLDSLSQREPNFLQLSQASLEAASLPPDYWLQRVRVAGSAGTATFSPPALLERTYHGSPVTLLLSGRG